MPQEVQQPSAALHLLGTLTPKPPPHLLEEKGKLGEGMGDPKSINGLNHGPPLPLSFCSILLSTAWPLSSSSRPGRGLPSGTEEGGARGASSVPSAEHLHQNNDPEAGHLILVVKMRKLRE